MPLFTSASLRERSIKKSLPEKEVLLTESSRIHQKFDIFLSHSFLDKDEVEGLYLILTGMGYSVYVDWIIDPNLDRKNVTKETAELIRKRMKSSTSLLFAISDKAEMSKWMPWELGFVDGNTSQCAIFPVSREQAAPSTFKRSEYLLLYPYIKKAAVDYLPEIFVIESSNYYAPFEKWVRGNAKPSYNYKNIDLL
jgi:TIR domain